MSSQQTLKEATPTPPNQAAHTLLTHLIERVGLNKRSFLDRLADLGYAFNDDDFTNWGRAGRSFPRNWPALQAMIRIVTEDHPPNRRCTAAEALHLLGLIGMPFPELRALVTLFPTDEFTAAMTAYIPAITTALPSEDDYIVGEHDGVAEGQTQRASTEWANSHLIGRGLIALTRLMWVPEVRDAVLSFRVDFQATREQIDVLADYKQLHELFQQLEDRYYLIYHEGLRLPADPSAWQHMERSEPEIQLIVDDLLSFAGQASVPADTTVWKHKLSRACEELRGAIEHGDTDQLKSATTRLKDVLGREPSRINTRLVSAAGAMRLAHLVRALTIVRDGLARLSLDHVATRRFEAFEHGVATLASLDHRLMRSIDTHNTFQEIDDELRRIEALLDQDVREIEYAWQNLKPLMQRLCGSNPSGWAQKLNALGGELESALGGQNPGRLVRLFRSYRSQAMRSFNQIDRDLLTLCEELRAVGEPLAAVLRMIA